MFDDLRQKSAQQAEFLNDEATLVAAPAAPAAGPGRRPRPFLGLTPIQGFVLALMLFLNVSVLGCLALVVFERIRIPLF
jgi:hypothetical protein